MAPATAAPAAAAAAPVAVAVGSQTYKRTTAALLQSASVLDAVQSPDNGEFKAEPPLLCGR